MGIKEWILPQEQKFFDLLEKQIGTVVAGAQALQTYFHAPGASGRKEVKDIEHRGDETVHQIFEALNATFVTPLDREDIVELARSMDSILDMIDAATNRFHLYEIKVASPGMLALAEVILQSTQELQRAVTLIHNMKNGDTIEAICVEINRLENHADDALNIHTAALFKESDVVQIIKQKEILERLEEATDFCEDVANVLSDIVAKNR